MGVVNTVVAILTIIICIWVIARKCRDNKWFTQHDQNIAAKVAVIMANGGYNFEDIIIALEKLSPKARATFGYLYVQSVAKDKKLFGTIKRYIDMKAAGVVVPQKPKGKGL